MALTESEQALKDAAATGNRVETGGGWARPDATLVRREDGSIGPKAAVVDLSFSGDGSGTGLATIGQDAENLITNQEIFDSVVEYMKTGDYAVRAYFSDYANREF
ncbi:hypothetical protein [Streptomyces venezuelae]|uniref:hypothetical protein n=1 Tax=Streptomyces venezuelae TaxID=54571 RepID=UPI0012391C16|nr:hypothetical protein [Streptomyces venezuelae]